MKPSTRILAAAAAAIVLALSYYLRSWGGLALLALAGGAFGWYRAQVARGEDTQQFFGDLGEETRLTSIQAAPSELPLDRTVSADPAVAPPPEGRGQR